LDVVAIVAMALEKQRSPGSRAYILPLGSSQSESLLDTTSQRPELAMAVWNMVAVICLLDVRVFEIDVSESPS
jgi:hypothetical protein